MKREDYGENKDRNIEDKEFVIFEIFSKQNKKKRKPMATNY